MNEGSWIVAVKRNPIYNIPEYREQCMKLVLTDFNKGLYYDTGGVMKYMFPWMKDKPNYYWCTELLNHYCINHTEGRINLVTGTGTDDNCTPWQIQTNKNLVDVKPINGKYPLRALDYVLTTSDSEVARIIKTVQVGAARERDPKVSTHGAIVLITGNFVWLGEMLMNADGVISSPAKYKVVA
jgi:hypothetical protein